MITQFVRDDASKSLNKLKDALNNFFIPIPYLVTNLDDILKNVVKELADSGDTLKGSDFNLKNLTDQINKYDHIRYVLLLFQTGFLFIDLFR